MDTQTTSNPRACAPRVNYDPRVLSKGYRTESCSVLSTKRDSTFAINSCVVSTTKTIELPFVLFFGLFLKY